MAYRLGVLDGDGIGPEIVPAAVQVLDAALNATGAEPVEWVPLPVGAAAIETHGSALPDVTVETLDKLDGWLLGPHDSASYPAAHRARLNPSGFLRKHFDLFANIRPARAFEGTPALVPGLDLVVVRENTEGFYADRSTYRGTGEFMPTKDVAIAMGIFTRPAIERIARQACELALRRRRHLTIVHKANVLRTTTGLFREICREIAADYPQLQVDDFHIDAMTVHLVRHGADFDVLVTENMFGDILSDLTGELAGSLGIAPSINASLDRAMAQAAHGSAPDIAGRGLANPTAMIASGAMLLDWLGATDAAGLIDQALRATVARGTRTADLGGTVGTSAFAEAVIGELT
ncbi:isocitrate/isopropylmalate dehydrogenase family protein [Kribbella jejuensis]|uniref:3-isopropylmalate dehydrogenase n=1 Tax=Kribbella jejuensis TaxID=236068 RepID=A0A542EQP3_9ACTN|nr:isocitrate/isopropylmalate dehydrogenase family protein [Kribbella jejuensis]TQJ17682.1 3-isopropylmalate dehydrogenase [Kribbella jejuensis]